VAKLADALASGASGRKPLGVQLPPSAPWFDALKIAKQFLACSPYPESFGFPRQARDRLLRMVHRRMVSKIGPQASTSKDIFFPCNLQHETCSLELINVQYYPCHLYCSMLYLLFHSINILYEKNPEQGHSAQ
jgi:hypothetical protein